MTIIAEPQIKMCGRCKVRPRKYQGKTNGSTYCTECIAEWTRENRRANPERQTRAHRKFLLKARYKMTPEQYDAMLMEQGGVCKCCGGLPPANRSLDVDHDHTCCAGRNSCGKCIRGLLCPDCNLLVGRFELGHLDKVLAYLGVNL